MYNSCKSGFGQKKYLSNWNEEELFLQKVLQIQSSKKALCWPPFTRSLQKPATLLTGVFPSCPFFSTSVPVPTFSEQSQQPHSCQLDFSSCSLNTKVTNALWNFQKVTRVTMNGSFPLQYVPTVKISGQWKCNFDVLVLCLNFKFCKWGVLYNVVWLY